MKKHSIVQTALSIACLVICQLIWADSSHLNVNNFWQCTTTDADHKTWVAEGHYRLTAINHAFANCKKQSASPKTCKTSKSSCDHIVNGKSTRPMWQCVALDRAANIWPSNPYTGRDDAALAALAYCKDNSDIPASCYMNMLTCRNMNATLIW